MKKKKIIAYMAMAVFGVFLAVYGAYLLDQIFRAGFNLGEIDLGYGASWRNIFRNSMQQKWFLVLEASWLLFLWISTNRGFETRTGMIKVTDKISIPQSVGQGQHGTARFMEEDEKKTNFCCISYPFGGKKEENLGLVLGMEKRGVKEKIYCLKEDSNTILIGSTRSGKTRGVILQSIWLKGKTDKSAIIIDPKGELYNYTAPYLENSGKEVIVLDFRQPSKSRQYNYMSSINEAIQEGDIPKAIDRTWDLVSTLVGVPKGEPLWTNGEAAVIAAAILAVAIESPEQYKNLTNVYYFISHMCKADENGDMAITKYFSTLSDEHPAKGVFAVAEISPEKMRGSFFGSALATLRHFSNWNIAAITQKSDFVLEDVTRKEMVLFIIVPDEKTTLYSLVSLFLTQAYIKLTEEANRYGGRLLREVDFICEEFGNCPTIPVAGAMLSVGAGRGMRFTLVIQDYQQLEKKYREDHENMKGNCLNTIYLRSTNIKTLEELSKRLGTYTCQVSSSNGSYSGSGIETKISNSSGVSMQSRPLLTAAEIERIERPYALVLRSGEYPGIFQIPDLSVYQANEELGLGNVEHNRKVTMERDEKRPIREIQKPELWGIWNQYNYSAGMNKSIPHSQPEEWISFLQ